MKSTKRLFLTLLTVAALFAGTWAQTSDSTTPPHKKTHKAVAAQTAATAADVQALKDAIAAQQQQIQQLTQQLQQLLQNSQQAQQTSQQAQATAAEAASKAAAAQTQTSEQQQSVVALKSDVTEIKTNATNAAMSLQESEKKLSAFESPSTIHIKGINITPGGFVAAEFVRRSRELGADVSTPFNNLTMPGASQSDLSEFFGSARQSRPTVYVAGRVKNAELSAYVSTDFLSAGDTSTATQTNSYTLRLRQAWGQAKFDNGWKFLGGQMWSLVTENAAGIAPSDDTGRVNDARPKTIDAGYNVGFSFARQYGVRVTKDFGDKASVAFAMENPQGTFTSHNNFDNFLLGETGDGKSYNNAINGTYTANPSPDLIAKAAFDPGFGHYEVFGLLDRFADRVFPCAEAVAAVNGNSSGATCLGVTTTNAALGAYNTSKEGGGFGANARWTFANKHLTFGLHGFGGSGIGRYGAAQLSDLSIHADGTPHLIKGFQGLGTLEWHGKKLDLYAYTGVEYAERSYDYDANLQVLTLQTSGASQGLYLYELKPGYVGYGSPNFRNDGCYVEQPPANPNPPNPTTPPAGFNPGSLAHCAGDTRAAIEGTAGFWYRFYSGPKGRFQFGTQYSYVTRQTWGGANSSGPAGISPEGLDGMVFTSFRYYLP